MPLLLLLGGARSGKSELAVRLAAARAAPVVLIATAEPRDQEMAARIAQHRRDRPAGWETLEAPLELEQAIAAVAHETTLIIDCLTLWVSNLLLSGIDPTGLPARAAAAAEQARARAGLTVAVSNEVGMGIVPDNELARRYRDVLGAVNAAWAAAADRARLLVAGRLLSLAPADALIGELT
ncbi:MAG: bifunctional adenosylcobinamide kinase/adenosylcobinamide-phosphate guanylyltransferase [Solirubrobacteraceae bacterium]